jgi:hypothetical protein
MACSLAAESGGEWWRAVAGVRENKRESFAKAARSGNYIRGDDTPLCSLSKSSPPAFRWWVEPSLVEQSALTSSPPSLSLLYVSRLVVLGMMLVEGFGDSLLAQAGSL